MFSSDEPQRYLNELMAKENNKWPVVLRPVPESEWPIRRPYGIVEVWRSREFLVQVFAEIGGIERLTICRTMLSGDSWKDNISWDELQEVKRQCGRGNKDAVEIYPADKDIVNVANMRHLWVLPDEIGYKWKVSE